MGRVLLLLALWICAHHCLLVSGQEKSPPSVQKPSKTAPNSSQNQSISLDFLLSKKLNVTTSVSVLEPSKESKIDLENVTVAGEALSKAHGGWPGLLGSQSRPRLEIVTPRNGEVLSAGELKVLIQIQGMRSIKPILDTGLLTFAFIASSLSPGHTFPSPLHGSLLCLALSARDFYNEECFEDLRGMKPPVPTLTPIPLTTASQCVSCLRFRR